MRVLLTGASSFTGYWFAQAISRAGHQVTAAIQGNLASYADMRKIRVERLEKFANVVENCTFGSEKFLALISSDRFDVLCHHGARVGDYRSHDFDILAAIAENTHELRKVCAVLSRTGASAIVSTGSVFEQDEGAGENPLRAFSPYGLSKGLTSQIIEHRCREAELNFGKFVIPNPFGPYEEPRFCSYLIRTWKGGGIASVKTASYIRDNIHIDLLAAAYVDYVTKVVVGTAPRKINPSGYVESQGAFAQRFAQEMQHRLNLPCQIDFARQTDFSEPRVRINTDPAAAQFPDWDECKSWDAIATFYKG